MKAVKLSIFIIIILFFNVSAQKHSLETDLLPGEKWWGGNVVSGGIIPFGNDTYKLNQYSNTNGNQGQPLFVSNKGRFIWSDDPLKIEITKSKIIIESSSEIELNSDGESLKEAFSIASSMHFPPSGEMPASLFFSKPQYNTWIEFQYNQNEKDILNYAASILTNDFPSGVIMIDDNWQTDYGNWEFSSDRFSKPKEMVEHLHLLGFKVMLWVCPFISADSPEFRKLEKLKVLMFADKEKTNPAIVRWWNGYSALIDLSHPEGKKWYTGQLQNLIDEYNVDGFKLDAGDASFYDGLYGFDDILSNEHTELHAEVGLHFPYNEYRASWKMGGQPLVQRLRDKRHEWEDLRALIPDMIALGLIGHPFSCPDMIGGGEIESFNKGANIDEELIVRSTQVSALMPMMQFSVAPWRVLNDENLQICRRMAHLHNNMGQEILGLAKQSAVSGEPIIRHMEYVFPHQGYTEIKDQFMLGNEILVAPVVEKGSFNRAVVLPKGKWQADDGKIFMGAKTIEVEAPLDRLPWFRLISN